MRILVIGDFIQDVYTFGTAARLCPEAPVPVLIPQTTRQSAGGVGLVAEQLKELGADINTLYLSYSEKHRYFAGNHLICRIDEDNQDKLASCKLRDEHLSVDAFVIADYGKGAMTPDLAHQIIETGLPCFVDAKHHWHWYAGRNVTIFPNEHECLDETFMADQVVRKLGKNGCEHFNLHLPASVNEVVDVTGAGDIFMAGFVFAWSLGFKPENCLKFANAIAGESCRHVGTYVVPQAFARAYLDRLRVSEASGQRVPYLEGDSNARGHQLLQRQDRSAAAPSISGSADSLLAGCMSAAIDSLKLPGSPPRVQTPQRSPSDPTGSSASQTQVDQRNSDGLGTKSQLGAQDQNPTESEHQCEHTEARDLAKILPQW